MPRISVLLPARNAEDTIAQAVSSTLRALPSDAELVVLDDGSTDATAERALRAGTSRAGDDPRLTVVSRPPSGGIAHALNWLLDNTDSGVVARMDADDISLPWRFAVTMPALKRGCDVAFTQVLNLRGRKVIPTPPVGISAKAFPVHLLMTNPVSHPTMVAKRAAIDAVGGYRAVPAEDYDLWIRCANEGQSLRRLSAWGLVYRQHSEQITASKQWRLSSWNDPQQAEAFRSLACTVVGQPMDRFTAVALKPPEERAPELDAMRALLRAAIDRMDPWERPLLRRRLNERLAWAAAIPEASGSGRKEYPKDPGQ